MENYVVDPVSIDVKNQTTETGMTISWPKLIGAVAVPALVFAYFLGSQGSDITGLRHDVDKSASRIDDIWKALPSLRASAVSVHPANASNQQAAKQLIAEAKEQKIPPIPTESVQQAGSAFIAASNDPGAWNVALDYVAYRSFLNQPPQYTWSQLSNSPDRIDWPSGGTRAFVTNETTACTQGAMQAHVMGKTAYFSTVPLDPHDPCAAYLRFVGGEVTLDGSYYINTTFENMRITYRGGPVRLENAIFVNCTFEMPHPTPEAMRLASAVLELAKVTLTTPKS